MFNVCGILGLLIPCIYACRQGQDCQEKVKASIRVRKKVKVTLNVTWLLVSDGLAKKFQTLLIYLDFPTCHHLWSFSKKNRKYPLSLKQKRKFRPQLPVACHD